MKTNNKIIQWNKAFKKLVKSGIEPTKERIDKEIKQANKQRGLQWINKDKLHYKKKSLID